MKKQSELISDSTATSGRRRRAAQRALHALLLLVAVLLLIPLPRAESLLVVVPALSPFVAAATVATVHAIHLATWLGLVVGAITLFRHRWFCRWICPTGTCTDYATRLGTKLRRRCPRSPPVGQWIAIVTLAGAVLGYPLLLWLDPLAMLSAALGLPRFPLQPEVGFGATALAAVLIASVLWPGIWCNRICPLGAFQDLLFSAARTARAAVARKRRGSDGAAGRRWSRRLVLGATVGGVWATLANRVCRSAPAPLRPPGAVDETSFRGLCIRCGGCQRVCPVDIIHPDTGAHGVSSLLSPRLDFAADYCREDCARCTDVCPSGALSPVPLEAKPQVSIGVPRVDMELCLLGDDRECSLCRNWCPYEAIRLVFSEEEYTLTPQVDLERCPGCGACELVCPTKPEKAIVIAPG